MKAGFQTHCHFLLLYSMPCELLCHKRACAHDASLYIVSPQRRSFVCSSMIRPLCKGQRVPSEHMPSSCLPPSKVASLSHRYRFGSSIMSPESAPHQAELQRNILHFLERERGI
jgi:hypothetical protein